MIEQVHIKNFQSHKDSTLKFSPGVNSIIGQSDSGKSTILRALKWVLYNKPNGDSIKSNWGGKTFVRVDFEWDVAITKQRDKTNTYDLDTELKHMEFKAIGSTIPKEIEMGINMNELNFQSQLDSPFFLSLTPGEAAKRLNEIVNLEVIDRSISKANSIIREKKQKEAFIQEEIDKQKEELKETEYIRQTYKPLKQAEELNKQLDEIGEQLSGLVVLKEDISFVEDELKQYSYINHIDFKKAEKIIKELDRLEDTKLRLGNLVVEIEGTDEAILSQSERIKNLENQFKKEFPDVCPLCGGKMK